MNPARTFTDRQITPSTLRDLMSPIVEIVNPYLSIDPINSRWQAFYPSYTYNSVDRQFAGPNRLVDILLRHLESARLVGPGKGYYEHHPLSGMNLFDNDPAPQKKMAGELKSMDLPAWEKTLSAASVEMTAEVAKTRQLFEQIAPKIKALGGRIDFEPRYNPDNKLHNTITIETFVRHEIVLCNQLRDAAAGCAIFEPAGDPYYAIAVMNHAAFLEIVERLMSAH